MKKFYDLKEKINNNNEFINDTDKLTSIVNEFKGLSSTSKALDYVNKKVMPVKIGNEKIGDDTIIINTNHALNCYCSKKGYCNIKKDCYAKKSSNRYVNSCMYNLAAEINFKNLSVEKIITDIESVIKTADTDIKFIRFNEGGDFISYDMFKKANKIATYFKNKYDIVSYSYTHNIELKDNIKDIDNSNIVLNYSYDVKTLLDVKKCIVINKSDIYNYINDDNNYVICGGVCTNCSYCKNKKEKRTVIFVNHKNKSTKKILKEVLSKKDLIKLDALKLKDYSNFLLDMI
jgi:hypothetical protein